MIKSLTTKKTKKAIKRFEEITGHTLCIVKDGKTVPLSDYYVKRLVSLIASAHRSAKLRKDQELLNEYKYIINGGKTL